MRFPLGVPIACFLTLLGALAAALWVDKELSADGAHYFAMILDGGDFTRVAWSRQWANVLTQWPLVLAVKLGVGDIPTLKLVFSAGIFLPFLASSFFVLAYGRRISAGPLLLLPVLAWCGLHFSSDFILTGEHHVFILMTWPILFLLLKQGPLSSWEGALLGALFCALTRCYETASIPAAFFFVLAGLRTLHFKEASERRWMFLIMGFAVATMVIGAWYTLHPRDPSNKGLFLQSLKQQYRNPEAVATALFSLGWVLALKWKGAWRWGLLAIPLAYVAWKFSWGAPSSTLSFGGRTLTVVLLPALLGMFLMVRFLRLRGDRMAGWLMLVFTLALVCGNLSDTMEWSRYRGIFTQVLREQRGYVPIEKTALFNHPVGWGWNHPELSAIWSAPRVRSVVLNPPGMETMPYDPQLWRPMRRMLIWDDGLGDGGR
jgi:hypothetical protein